ncbi:hypothetical protein BsWGS_18254 [Bradybaena similaris]
MSYNSTDDPSLFAVNQSEPSDNLTEVTHQMLPVKTAVVDYDVNSTRSTAAAVSKENKAMMARTISDGTDVPRDSPTPLIIASSIAAVSILVFFVLAYLWHTHQLDSRARKLAIRLAADAEHGMNCRNCELQVSKPSSRIVTKAAVRVTSESSPEPNLYIALTPDDDRGPGSDCGRSSVGVSESEVGDEDVFESFQLSSIGERSRGGFRGGRGSHRKWSRTRKISGHNLDKRDSAVTDKEILTHFASRRHSTFFI